jgi:hypothetical protein
MRYLDNRLGCYVGMGFYTLFPKLSFSSILDVQLMVLSFLGVQADQAKKVGCLLFYDALVQDGLADCVGWQQVKLRNEMPRDELGQAALVAIRKGAKRSLIALLDAGADVNHVSPDRPFCPLIQESIFGDREALFYTLLSHPEVNLNKGDCEGRTSLHWAVKKGDMCFVAALLRHQASMRMLWYRAIQFMPEDIRKTVFSSEDIRKKVFSFHSS